MFALKTFTLTASIKSNENAPFSATYGIELPSISALISAIEWKNLDPPLTTVAEHRDNGAIVATSLMHRPIGERGAH